MAYATAADLRARYSAQDLRDLTDEQGEVIDDAALTRALEDASDVVDGHLQGRYPLPLTRVPRLFTQLVCELAMYALLRNRPEAAVKDAKERADNWLRYLQKVAKGEIGLSPASDHVAPVDVAVVEQAGPDRLFTRGSLRGL